MGMGKSVTVGYRYYMGIHMGLGRGPVDELVEIQVDGKQAFKGSVTASGQVAIDKPDLFGGEMKEGGLKGTLDVLMGEPTQTAPARLAGMLGGAVPGFRGMATLFYDGLVSAMTPYLKTWKMRVRRSTAGWDGGAWYPEKATVVLPVDGDAIHAMNGAHILYECLTNRDWGGGMDRSRLDDASFRAAADQLYAEGFGLCLRWARQDSVGSFIQTVCDHLAADLYLSRFDGTWYLRLIRADYDPASLPLFDEDSGLLGIDDDDNGASAGAANELVVRWHDPLKDQDRHWRERNLAAIQADGQVLSTTLDYSGLPTAELAGRVAVRELRTRASSLKRFKVRLDRRGYGIEPGQPFRIRSRARGIDGLVLRAGRIEDGTLDSATLTITAVQDVFGLPAGGMTEVQPSGWTPPDRTPQAVTQRVLMEQTWRDLVRRTDAANLALIDPSDSYLASVASKPTALSLGYTLETRVGSAAWTARDDGGAFCPSGVLTAALGPTETAFTLSDGLDLDFVEVGGAALLGEEIVRIDAFDPATLSGTLGRGCVDTVPARHAAGSRLWFLDEGYGLDPSAYVAGTTVQARLLTQAGGVLDPALAPVDSLTLAQRQGRPYPPGQLRLNGAAYPARVTGDIVLTWAHRDRLLQADQLIDSEQGSIGPEPGTTYGARLLRADNLAQLVGSMEVSGDTVTLKTAYVGTVIAELWSNRNGLESWQRAHHPFERLPGPGELPIDPNTGIVWTARTTPAANAWVDIVWSSGAGLFVAVASSGTGNRVMTSPDGVTWTLRASAADNNWQSVTWSPELGLFVAVASSGTGNRVMTSPDGMSWTLRASAADNNWRRVTWSPELGLFVAVASSGTGNRVMTSPDGMTWTLRASAADNSWVSVAWSAARGLLVAVAPDGAGNRVMTSPDGIHWTARAAVSDSSWFDLVWSPELGLFVAVAFDGADSVMTSPNGIDWTARTPANDLWWRGITWSPEAGLFVAVAITGTGNRVMTSSDGMTWTARTTPVDNSWTRVCWSRDRARFVAITYDGTDRVMTSL